jgi:uncharacterized protein YegL
MTNLNFRECDLIDNPSTRIPICLCLDVSPSMSGNPIFGAAPGTVGVPIDELNRGVAAFFEALREDPSAHRAAEVAIVAYADGQQLVRPFGTIDEDRAPVLQLNGNGTHIGSAVEHCLDLLEERKRQYRNTGVEYFQPWLVLMTDGQPTDFSHVQAGPRASALVNDRKLTVFPIGIGNGANLDALARFSPRTQPLRLDGLKFREFFAWLSSSVSCVSRSQPDQSITLDSSAIGGWTTL